MVLIFFVFQFGFSVQVEQQHLRRLHSDQFNVRFVVNRRRVAADQRLAVQLHFALGDVNPRMESGVQLVRDPVCHRPGLAVRSDEGNCEILED